MSQNWSSAAVVISALRVKLIKRSWLHFDSVLDTNTVQKICQRLLTLIWDFKTLNTAGHIIRIHHECEGRIEKSVPMINAWHHEACWVMTNGDLQGRIFISHPHTNNGFFSLLNIKFRINVWKRTPRSSWIRRDADTTWWRHFSISMTSLDEHVSEFQYSQCTAFTWQPG